MKKLLYALVILSSIVAAMYSYTNLLWGGMCGNEIIAEIRSPSKKLKAVIFIRDCGATTGYSTQLTVMENSGILDNDEGGNVLIMSDKNR
jgi:hypothetical protein